MADATAGQILTARTFNMKVRKCIARARRTTTSSTSSSSTPVAVLRLDDIPILAGHTYRITWIAKANTTVAGDVTRGIMHFTTDGTVPTSANAQVLGSTASTTEAGTGSTLVCVTDYTPSVDQTYSVLLSIFRNSGTGAVSFASNATTILTQIYIDDMGDDPGNTGTDL